MERKVHPNENDINLLYHANKFCNENVANGRWDGLNKHLSPAKIERLKKLGWVKWEVVEHTNNAHTWSNNELQITAEGLEAIKDMATIKQAEQDERDRRQKLFNEARKMQADSLKSYLEGCGIKFKYVYCYSDDATNFSVELPLALRIEYKYEYKTYCVRVCTMSDVPLDTDALMKEVKDAALVRDYLNMLVEMEKVLAQ